MLSYQHSYHAGNLADVHKHLALVMLLERLRRKAAPFCFVDSHAGRGRYDLAGAEAQKTGEAAQGILKLRALAHPPAPLRSYLDMIAAYNDGAAATRWYPGSAALAAALLREQDRAILLELHPQEQAALKRELGRDRRIAVHARDCFEGLPALLPPPIRRGLVLIDPSYEERDEYRRIAALLARALERWATGIYLLWYPLLPDARQRALEHELAKLAPPNTVVSEFRFSAAAVGLQGSGLAVVNAPWEFDVEFAAAMERLIQVLSSDNGRHRIITRELGPPRTRRA